MIAKIPIVIPNKVRTVLILLTVTECNAIKKLSARSFMNNI
jgi:hypothetical protein